MLKRGERVFVASDPYELQPILVHVQAHNYDELEQRMVPADERSSEKYDGFTLLANTSDLNTKFMLVRESTYEWFRYVVRRFVS